MLRCQPPVHSPLPPRALGAGLRALLGGGASAEAAVVEQLRRQYGPRQVLRTDSGTSALTLALRHLARTAPGRSVALPAYCCYDVATAADGARIPVALYDLDPATLGPDLDSLRRALAAGAAGVVIAHLYGIPVEVDQVLALARDHGALVIDDAAQGAGAAYEGAPVGTFGAFGILSFGRGKGVTGSGGGALLANDATSARALPDLAASLTPGGGGRGAGPLVAAAAQWLLARPTLYGVPAALPFLRLGETIYRPPVPPAPPAAVQSAILAATWPLAAAEDEVRRRHAGRLLAVAQQSGYPTIRVPAGSRAGYLRLPLALAPAARPRLAAARRLGVMPGYPKALIDLAGFGSRAQRPAGSCAGARLLAERLCTLPTHSLLRERDLRRLEAWLEGSAALATQ